MTACAALGWLRSVWDNLHSSLGYHSHGLWSLTVLGVWSRECSCVSLLLLRSPSSLSSRNTERSQATCSAEVNSGRSGVSSQLERHSEFKAWTRREPLSHRTKIAWSFPLGGIYLLLGITFRRMFLIWKIRMCIYTLTCVYVHTCVQAGTCVEARDLFW